MRVVLIADGTSDRVTEGLADEGITDRAGDPAAAAGDGASAELVAALRGAEEALAADPPDAVLVTGQDDRALAAALTAVKLQIPTGWLGPAGTGDAPVARIADARLDATTPAVDLATAIRDLTARTIPSR